MSIDRTWVLMALVAGLTTGACTFDYDAFLEGAGGAAATGASDAITSAATTSAATSGDASTGQGGASTTGGGAGGPTGSTTSSAGGAGGEATSASSSSAGGGGAGGGAPEVLPRHCNEIVGTEADVGDGSYRIDPDGPGGVEPYLVRCDMTIDGGGWTRFNWLQGAYPSGADPLELALHECDVDAPICRGRIPSVIAPTHFLVKDLTDGAHAAWAFDGSDVSNAMVAALRDKGIVCVGPSGTSFDPYLDTSQEPYCGTNGECDSFKYGNSGCNGTTDWVLTLDDDSHYCRAAFKLGRATGSGNCGDVDWGFLDDCECNDEAGELYFR